VEAPDEKEGDEKEGLLHGSGIAKRGEREEAKRPRGRVEIFGGIKKLTELYTGTATIFSVWFLKRIGTGSVPDSMSFRDGEDVSDPSTSPG
jgi:hypothetical protein